METFTFKVISKPSISREFVQAYKKLGKNQLIEVSPNGLGMKKAYSRLYQLCYATGVKPVIVKERGKILFQKGE